MLSLHSIIDFIMAANYLIAQPDISIVSKFVFYAATFAPEQVADQRGAIGQFPACRIRPTTTISRRGYQTGETMILKSPLKLYSLLRSLHAGYVEGWLL